MTSLGYVRRAHKAHDQLTARLDATTNRAGGLAFEVCDPSIKLLTMIGSSFFDEPTYYGDNDAAQALWQAVKPELFTATGGIRSRISGLSLRTQEIITTALDVAAGPNPRDLLAIAHWARREMNIRTTPSVLLAVAAAHPATKRYVRGYCAKIIGRADELRQVFAAYVHLFGRPLPNALKRGLADAFRGFGEYELLRYDTADRPNFADVLRMIERGKDRAVGKAMWEYLVHGRVVDPAATPLLAARKKLAKQHFFDDQARTLASEGRATWEMLLSQFGNKREVWEFVIREQLIGYMALLRNLRNIVLAGVDIALIEQAARQIEDGVIESKQLPFRFVSAYRALTVCKNGFHYSRRLPKEDDRLLEPLKEGSKSIMRLLAAIDSAMLAACAALHWIPGTTLIAADNSGSMSQGLSANSSISAADAANILCAMAARICERPIVWAFGTDVAAVPVDRHASLMVNADRVAAADTRGCSTNAYRIFQELTAYDRRVDRVILLSDMQCWNSDQYAGDRQLAPEFIDYRNSVNPDVWLHSIDLMGYGKAVVPTDTPRVNLVSGFSEKILDMVLMAEGLLGPGQDRALPTIEYIRTRY